MASLTEPERDEPVRILLVDDNAANLFALETVLESLGQELVSAHSGAEALEKLNEQDCALVLMDVHMPILDGFQTVEAIRKRNELRHLPVMFLTALFRDSQSAARGYALGAVDFIMKPFEPEIIRAKVGAFVALYQYNQKLKRQQRLLATETAARKAAEAADRTKEEFIAILGHDLRTPLNAIILTAESHQQFADALDHCREAGKRIETSAGRMSRMIDDVVDFTRSRLGGGIPLDLESADMRVLCRAPIDELHIVDPTCKISVLTDGDTRGRWDPDRVTQVIANLVGNAVRHGTGVVSVLVTGTEDVVVLKVHNDGAPIPPDKMEHLFTPFHPGGRRREGLGLGLYIVEQIVHAHGGTIGADSSTAAGTTFTVRWPRGSTTSR